MLGWPLSSLSPLPFIALWLQSRMKKEEGESRPSLKGERGEKEKVSRPTEKTLPYLVRT